MDSKQRIKQAQACHIRFKQLQRKGCIPAVLNVYEFASQMFGREICSLTWLENWELNAFRDRLEGKRGKLLEKLYELAGAAGIGDLSGWMRHNAAKHQGFAYLAGHTPESLPVPLQYRLSRCLSARAEKRQARKSPQGQPGADLFTHV